MKLVSCLKYNELDKSEIIENDEGLIFIKVLGADKKLSLGEIPKIDNYLYYTQIGTCMYIGVKSFTEGILFFYVIEQQVKDGKLSIKNIYSDVLVEDSNILAKFFRYDKEFQEDNLRRRLLAHINFIPVIIEKEYLTGKITEYLDRNDRVEEVKELVEKPKAHFVKKESKPKKATTIEPVTVNGVTYNSKYAFARAFNIPQSSMFKYIEKGMSLEEILEMYKDGSPKRGAKPKNKYEYLGDQFSMKELSELSGLSTGLLENRINMLGWTVEKAVETPLNSNKEEN